jgi:hypothetical protein
MHQECKVFTNMHSIKLHRVNNFKTTTEIDRSYHHTNWYYMSISIDHNPYATKTMTIMDLDPTSLQINNMIQTNPTTITG